LYMVDLEYCDEDKTAVEQHGGVGDEPELLREVQFGVKDPSDNQREISRREDEW